jgi:hypothetical protein
MRQSSGGHDVPQHHNYSSRVPRNRSYAPSNVQQDQHAASHALHLGTHRQNTMKRAKKKADPQKNNRKHGVMMNIKTMSLLAGNTPSKTVEITQNKAKNKDHVMRPQINPQVRAGWKKGPKHGL